LVTKLQQISLEGVGRSCYDWKSAVQGRNRATWQNRGGWLHSYTSNKGLQGNRQAWFCEGHCRSGWRYM